MAETKREDRFVELVNESQGIIHKICRLYCENEEHRKDLFQEIIIQLWKAYPSFRGDARFSTWLYRVALNVAIQDLRKTKKRRLLIFESQEFEEYNSPTFSEVENEQLRKMYMAIRQLSKTDRAIIMLYLENKSNQEISEIMGITINYVRVKMTRIRKNLSDQLTSK